VDLPRDYKKPRLKKSETRLIKDGRTVVLCISQAELSNAPGLEKRGLTAKVEKQTPSGITF